MPLTLSIYGSDPKKSGHIIIDRNNLIFAFPVPKDSSPESIRMTGLCRQRITELFSETYTQLNTYKDNTGRTRVRFPLSNDESFARMDDPRHDALEHMSSYDRNQCHHMHYIFKEDITYELIHMVFSNLNINGHEDLISSDCVKNILHGTKEHFSFLDTSTEAKKIETEYREEKKHEYEQAVKSVAENNVKMQTLFVGFYNSMSALFATRNRNQNSKTKDENPSFDFGLKQ